MNTITTVTAPTSIREIMASVNGASFVGIDTATIPKLKGGEKNPMQGRVTKINMGSNVMVFQNKNTNGYDNMVKRRLQKEGKNPDSFSLSPRKWGVRETGTPFVEHKGELYLEVIFLKSGTVSYELDGETIAKSDIVGLAEKKEGEQGGLSDKVPVRTFKVGSISAIRINNTMYTNIVS